MPFLSKTPDSGATKSTSAPDPALVSRAQLDILWRVVFVFAGYYLGSKIGFLLTFRPYAVSTLWPTNAILMSALIISQTRMWPLLILAAFPAHLAVQFQSEVPFTMVLCWFVSNSSEALIGAGLIRRFLKNPVPLDSLREFHLFLLFSALIAPFLSSFLDAAFVKLNHWSSQSYWQIWSLRFFSNVLAGLTITPVIIAWSQTDIASSERIVLQRYIEATLLICGLSVVTLAVFNLSRTSTSNPAWLYLPLPFLLWAAARFGLTMLSTSILLVAIVAIWGAVHGRGPFDATNAIDNAFYIQMFVIVFSYPLLLFASALQERKKVRERSMQNEERFHLALSAAKMSTWDLHIPTGEITLSEGYKRMVISHLKHGYMDLGSFLNIHPDDRQKVSHAISRAMERGGTYEVEFRIVRPKGEVLFLLGKGEVLFDDRGEPVRLLGVNVDITERREVEEERRRAELLSQEQRQELYHLSRVGILGELSGAIAHELNQPLTAILSNAQAAQRFLKKRTIDLNEVSQIVNDIIDQDRRAGAVIKRLRSLLKKGELERRPVNLNNTVREVLNLANSELITHNIDVSMRLSETLPKLKGDPVQLHQVLLNLVLNSVESMTKVDPAERRLTITTDTEGTSIVLSVHDEGTGIPQEMLDRIFEPFHTTKQNGLGLGLSISRAIVVAHGGQLSATNNADKGATFLLSLPIQ